VFDSDFSTHLERAVLIPPGGIPFMDLFRPFLMDIYLVPASFFQPEGDLVQSLLPAKLLDPFFFFSFSFIPLFFFFFDPTLLGKD